MTTSISNAPVETSLPLMVSGGEVPMQDLKGSRGQGPSAFASLMASQYGAAGEANAGAARAATETTAMPNAIAVLQSRLDLITGMLGLAEGEAASPMAALPQGLSDGKPLPLPEIVAALEGAAAALEGMATQAQPAATTGVELAQIGEEARARLMEATDLLNQQGLDQMPPQLAARIAEIEQLLRTEAAGVDPAMEQAATAVPLGYALGHRMLQQLSGPIGRHLGQHEGQGQQMPVGLQLGHQLQAGGTPRIDGAASQSLPVESAQAAEVSAMDAPDPLSLLSSQATSRPGQAPASDAGVDPLPALARTASALEVASLPMGPVAASVPTVSATTAPAYQAPPVLMAPGQPGWDQAMGERIMWMVGKDIQGAEVRINPPHLGPIEIRVALQNDQASVTFAAHHAGVREALEAAIPRLREMLSENNLQLVNVDVGQRDRGEQHGPSDFLRRLASGEAEQGLFAAEGDDGLALPLRVYQSEGMVDFYA